MVIRHMQRDAYDIFLAIPHMHDDAPHVPVTADVHLIIADHLPFKGLTTEGEQTVKEGRLPGRQRPRPGVTGLKAGRGKKHWREYFFHPEGLARETLSMKRKKAGTRPTFSVRQMPDSSLCSRFMGFLEITKHGVHIGHFKRVTVCIVTEIRLDEHFLHVTVIDERRIPP